MSEILACRVCMSTNVKLYDMYKNKLTTAFEILTGLEVTPPIKLPTCICGACNTLLIKYTQFRETCQRTQDLLVFSYQQNHEVSTEYIESLKLNYHPLSNLSVCTVVNEDISQTSAPSNSTLMPIDNIKDSIKTDLETGQNDFCTVKSEEINYDATEEAGIDDAEDLNNDSLEGLLGLPEADADEKLDRSDTESQINKWFIVKFLTKEQQLEEVQARRLSTNYGTSLYKCNKCFRGFMTDVTFKNHLVKHDPTSGRYECEMCLARFPTQRAFRHHNARSHERQYKCRWCSFVTKARSQAIGHSKWHDGQVFVCNTCGATFRKASSHLTHVRLHHPSEHVCLVCGESFIGKRGLLMHAKRAHRQATENGVTTEGAMFTCDACSVDFRTKDALLKHMATAVGDCADCKPCVYCGEDIGTNSDMKQHLSTHIRRKSCEHCKRTFPNERNYAIHVQRVHCRQREVARARSVVCEICGKSYKTKSLLTVHQRTHTGETPYECNLCPRKFTLHEYLKIHIRKHTGETPYPCNECPKKFKNKAALNRHLRVHTGEKPYSCYECGKSFSQSNSVKVHVQTVHLKQPTPYKNKMRTSKPKDVDLPVIG